MRNLKSILVFAFISILVSSCNRNDEPVLEPVAAKTATNIHAPVSTDRTVNPPSESGEFTKFNLRTGAIVSNDSWDIALRGTSIIVNSGAGIGLADEPERTGNGPLTIETGLFGSILDAPEAAAFKQDAVGT